MADDDFQAMQAHRKEALKQFVILLLDIHKNDSSHPQPLLNEVRRLFNNGRISLKVDAGPFAALRDLANEAFGHRDVEHRHGQGLDKELLLIAGAWRDSLISEIKLQSGLAVAKGGDKDITETFVRELIRARKDQAVGWHEDHTVIRRLIQEMNASRSTEDFYFRVDPKGLLPGLAKEIFKSTLTEHDGEGGYANTAFVHIDLKYFTPVMDALQQFWRKAAAAAEESSDKGPFGKLEQLLGNDAIRTFINYSSNVVVPANSEYKMLIRDVHNALWAIRDFRNAGEENRNKMLERLIPKADSVRGFLEDDRDSIKSRVAQAKKLGNPDFGEETEAIMGWLNQTIGALQEEALRREAQEQKGKGLPESYWLG